MSARKELILRALDNIQAEERERGPASPQTMLLRAMNITPNDRSAADQGYTLGGEIMRITEQVLGPECWEWAVVKGERKKPGPHPDPMTPGDPPQGTLFAMLFAMRLGREIGRLESER